MAFLPNIIFAIILFSALYFFRRNIFYVKRNIQLGKSIDRSDQSSKRWSNMFRIALGQSKMVNRPIAGILHIIVYIGFIVINIELIEIVLDGLLGTHRIFAPFMGKAYNVLIATFEILAALVLVSVILFWLRRNILKIKRFWKAEMKGWPKNDANYILYFEIVLMTLFLSMNATDLLLQQIGDPDYPQAGMFPVSQFLAPLFSSFSVTSLVLFERSFWWLHISGILIFLNYLYYSKHLHILLAFPNTYFQNLNPKGAFKNNETVTKEVKLMLDPAADPYAAPAEDSVPEKFGASDVTDLNWVQLMNAYTCTECGRCTDECPANQTGKLLSPRKIMMDTRDRLEEVGNNINNKGKHQADGKQLLDDYITKEELWACTSCNACVETCPIGIDPLSIIMDMRQYLVMEQSAAPSDLNNMMTNIENNGAPWPFNNQDRMLWAIEN
ncbi:MAG: (Fe-S)-binding protein [Flavobacteriaceae bacterium]|jgi:heterodisulfide reductase subunit C|nr:(Fe-S)-binding protein [Flavobacteriaceae bacterium]